MPIKNVALLGADGSLGPLVLTALLDAKFTVTVLKRESSKSASNYPPSVKETRIPDDFPEYSLIYALKGQDAVVVTIRGSHLEPQRKLALAAAKAGVSRFIPADFGSVDSESELARQLLPLYVQKRDLRLYLQELVGGYEGFSWTSLVCGHFFDWGLDFMHIFPKERRIDVIDDGSVRASASTLKLVGRATAKILLKADDRRTKNKLLYVQSFCKSQNELREGLERVTGEKWTTQSFEKQKFVDEKMQLLQAGETAAEDQVVWWLGAVDANWEKNEGFAMDLLEMEEEDLDEVLRETLKK